VASGRPWWQVRYRDGSIVSEWDSVEGPSRLPLRELGHSSRWEELRKTGLIAIRLLCPDGVAAELEASEDRKIFQFKVGGIAVGPEGLPQGWCDAYVIGAVLDADGNCLCRSWETRERQLVDFKDNVFDMKYRGLGPLGLDNLGIRV
jgi:hypothetical protein